MGMGIIGTDGTLEHTCLCGTKVAMAQPDRAVATLEKRLTTLELQLQQLRGDMADFSGLHTGLVKRIEKLEGGKVA
jgi:hypothetical protein